MDNGQSCFFGFEINVWCCSCLRRQNNKTRWCHGDAFIFYFLFLFCYLWYIYNDISMGMFCFYFTICHLSFFPTLYKFKAFKGSLILVNYTKMVLLQHGSYELFSPTKQRFLTQKKTMFPQKNKKLWYEGLTISTGLSNFIPKPVWPISASCGVATSLLASKLISERYANWGQTINNFVMSLPQTSK